MYPGPRTYEASILHKVNITYRLRTLFCNRLLQLSVVFFKSVSPGYFLGLPLPKIVRNLIILFFIDSVHSEI